MPSTLLWKTMALNNKLGGAKMEDLLKPAGIGRLNLLIAVVIGIDALSFFHPVVHICCKLDNHAIAARVWQILRFARQFVIRSRRIKWNTRIGSVQNVKTRNLKQISLLQPVEG